MWEKGVTSLPEMIRRMTSMPARVYALHTKGLIWEGIDADICLFDPETIQDKCTYQNRSLRAEGLHYVIPGGKVVVENAVYKGTRAGRLLLRKNQYNSVTTNSN